MDLNSLGSFDANQHAPKQLGASVPPGKWPFVISDTAIVPTKANDGGMFVVTFNTPSGQIAMRYNLWNQSPKAVEIAHGQLSALCHATGVFNLKWPNQGAELRNAQGMIEVGLQDPDKPDGYTEVKKVYDKNGNEPGKGAAPAPQVQPQPQQAPTQGAQGTGWGNASQPQQQAPQAQAPQGWSQGPSTGQAPPWTK